MLARCREWWVEYSWPLSGPKMSSRIWETVTSLCHMTGAQSLRGRGGRAARVEVCTTGKVALWGIP